MIRATANGSNTITIKIIKNLTTELSGTPKDSATKRKPPTSFSILILLFLITLIESNAALFLILNSSILFEMELISLSADLII